MISSWNKIPNHPWIYQKKSTSHMPYETKPTFGPLGTPWYTIIQPYENEPNDNDLPPKPPPSRCWPLAALQPGRGDGGSETWILRGFFVGEGFPILGHPKTSICFVRLRTSLWFCSDYYSSRNCSKRSLQTGIIMIIGMRRTMMPPATLSFVLGVS